jgi:predicted  nucleic acid-binding Zn-ribbon protein
MTSPAKITATLKSLCELENKKGLLADALTDRERNLKIVNLRKTLPPSILEHHDRMMRLGRKSVSPVVHGVCSSCHLKLPSGHLARLRGRPDLEVCDNCGVFIYLESEEAPTRKAGKREHAHS